MQCKFILAFLEDGLVDLQEALHTDLALELKILKQDFLEYIICKGLKCLEGKLEKGLANQKCTGKLQQERTGELKSGLAN